MKKINTVFKEPKELSYRDIYVTLRGPKPHAKMYLTFIGIGDDDRPKTQRVLLTFWHTENIFNPITKSLISATPTQLYIRAGEIEVTGHWGTWYVIDARTYSGRNYYLLEHNEYGDEAACVIIDEDLKLIQEDVWNGFEDFVVPNDVLLKKLFLNLNAAIIVELGFLEDAFDLNTYLDAILIDRDLQHGYLAEVYQHDETYYEKLYKKIYKEVIEYLEVT